ncbi:MAG: nucleotidyl transferase AbiEii/AbiGii toxin family protein [Acidimicrobiales bacterium]
MGDTKIQFLDTADQAVLRPATIVEGIPVASVEDILAMKLNAIVGRAMLRDYFDIMMIETQTNLSVPDGMRFFVRRYRPKVPADSVASAIRALGYLGDVTDAPVASCHQGRD